MRATAFAPGSIGNVGPGFDVLGLAVEGIGDRVTVTLTDGAAAVESVSGLDADLVPREMERNCAAIAAMAMLRMLGVALQPRLAIEKGLALSGGMGGSAASSVAGAYAAALAAERTPSTHDILAAALAGEAVVSGNHLDNISPSTLGGLALSRSVDPIDVIALPVAKPWWVAMVTPKVRVETKQARSILPAELDRKTWIQMMANTTALAHSFGAGDGALLGRALDDLYAEPRRASLIPHFHEVKRAALDAGAYGSSISGSGPTIFAICEDEATAIRCAAAMQQAFGDVGSSSHVGAIATKGVRAV